MGTCRIVPSSAHTPAPDWLDGKNALMEAFERSQAFYVVLEAEANEVSEWNTAPSST